jgi:D-alanyl-D-alanine carboxypeptidase
MRLFTLFSAFIFSLIGASCAYSAIPNAPLHSDVQTVHAAPPVENKFSEAQQEKIQTLLNNWRVRTAIPGATLSIYIPAQNSRLTINSGTTMARGGQSITDSTWYQAGSISKSFTAAIILDLEAKGKLNINDPITKYLPQYPQWKSVTIRELLNHTSGIFNYTAAGIFNRIRSAQPRAEFTPAQLVAIATRQHSYFPPGKGWKYSNTNYVLAGMIIEKVTGQPMMEVMNYYLHRGGFHMDLSNTYYAPGLYSGALMARMAYGYSSSGIDTTYDNMSWAYTAGAIVTTTQDLLTWWHGLFQGNILPKAQMDQMMTLVCEASSENCRAGQLITHISNNPSSKGYGLGIIKSGFGSQKIGPVWWHNGSTRGYKALVMWFPQNDIYMALTINRDPGYLLKPELPLIRRVLAVLVPGLSVPAYEPAPHHHVVHHKHAVKRHHSVAKKNHHVEKKKEHKR